MMQRRVELRNRETRACKESRLELGKADSLRMFPALGRGKMLAASCCSMW